MFELWSHQKLAIEKAKLHQNLALFMDVGTGKTRTMIEILRGKYTEAGYVRPTVILAPLVVLHNWKREFLKFSKIREDLIYVLDGSQAKRVKTVEMACKHKTGILITNYEALQMDMLMRKIVTEFTPDILVCDESHRLKNPQSLRAKKCMSLGDRVHNRYLLTGTPILNSLMDAYMQFRILDKGDTFGTNFYAFRAKYFVDKNEQWKARQNYFPKWEPRTELYPDLHFKIMKKAVRAVKAECLDLPPLVRTQIEVEMGKDQMRAYLEMEKEFVTFIESQGENLPSVASLAITKALRLQQIVSGFLGTEEGEAVAFKDVPRLDALMDLLEDLTPSSKVIVWAAFKANYRDIEARLVKSKIGYTTLTGDTPAKEREGNLEKFRTDPDCRVIVMNQAAGGVGITLIESDVSIYYSKNFSLEQDLQSEARNYRGGSEIHKKVTRIDLVCKQTIDKTITDALQSKLDVSKAILEYRGAK